MIGIFSTVIVLGVFMIIWSQVKIEKLSYGEQEIHKLLFYVVLFVGNALAVVMVGINKILHVVQS